MANGPSSNYHPVFLLFSETLRKCFYTRSIHFSSHSTLFQHRTAIQKLYKGQSASGLILPLSLPTFTLPSNHNPQPGHTLNILRILAFAQALCPFFCLMSSYSAMIWMWFLFLLELMLNLVPNRIALRDKIF